MYRKEGYVYNPRVSCILLIYVIENLYCEQVLFLFSCSCVCMNTVVKSAYLYPED